MKKMLYSVIIVLILSTVSVMASESLEKKEAVQRPDFVFVVDGKLKTLSNAAYTIDNVTYVPVRELSTLLGNDVDYEKGVISISSHEEVVEETRRLTIEEIEARESGSIPSLTIEEQIELVEFELNHVISTIAYYEQRKIDVLAFDEVGLAKELDRSIVIYTLEKVNLENQLIALQKQVTHK